MHNWRTLHPLHPVFDEASMQHSAVIADHRSFTRSVSDSWWTQIHGTVCMLPPRQRPDGSGCQRRQLCIISKTVDAIICSRLPPRLRQSHHAGHRSQQFTKAFRTYKKQPALQARSRTFHRQYEQTVAVTIQLQNRTRRTGRFLGPNGAARRPRSKCSRSALSDQRHGESSRYTRGTADGYRASSRSC